MGVFAFALAIFFVPAFPAAATAPRWALLAFTLPALCISRSLLRISGGHVLGALFITWAAVTMLWTPERFDGYDTLFKFCLLGGAFYVGSTMTTLRPVYIGAAIGLAISAAFMMAQLGGWDGVAQTQRPGGLFLNRAFVGEFAALVLAGILAERVYWLAAIPGLCMALSFARAPLLALAAGSFAFVRHPAVLAGLLLVAAGVLTIVRGPGAMLTTRLNLWSDTAGALTFFGHGVGSFFTTFPEFTEMRDTRWAFAHNDFLQIAYELGAPGIALYMALLGYVLSGDKHDARAVVIVFMACGLFGFPLYMPATGCLAALAAGYLCRERRGVRDAFARRGDGLRGSAPPHYSAGGRAGL